MRLRWSSRPGEERRSGQEEAEASAGIEPGVGEVEAWEEEAGREVVKVRWRCACAAAGWAPPWAMDSLRLDVAVELSQRAAAAEASGQLRSSTKPSN